MKKLIVIFMFLSVCYTTSVFAGYGGSIGDTDNREYGSLSDPIYRSVVKITKNGAPRCMGSFISKNLVLSNSHCLYNCGNACSATFWNGEGYETSNLKVVRHNGKGGDLYSGTDWAVALSDKENKFYKPVTPTSTPGFVFMGGYGSLRIIKDLEIPLLKKIYRETLAGLGKGEYSQTYVNELFEAKIKEKGITPLFNDYENFKVQKCTVFLAVNKSDKLIETDCDSSGGDSGTPFLRDGQVVGLFLGGKHYVFTKETLNGAVGIKTENFYDEIQKLIKEYE